MIGDSWDTHADRVFVSVEDGVVTLLGKVPTARDARRLVHASHLVTGVLDVKDELENESGDKFMDIRS